MTRTIATRPQMWPGFSFGGGCSQKACWCRHALYFKVLALQVTFINQFLRFLHPFEGGKAALNRGCGIAQVHPTDLNYDQNAVTPASRAFEAY